MLAKPTVGRLISLFLTESNSISFIKKKHLSPHYIKRIKTVIALQKILFIKTYNYWSYLTDY